MKIAEFLYTDKNNFKYTFKIEVEENDSNSVIFKTGPGTMISPQTIGLTNRKLFELIGKTFNPRQDYKSPMIELYSFSEVVQDKKKTDGKDDKYMKDTWDFVEKYHPLYYSSDEICAAQSILLKQETEVLTQDESDQLNYLLKSIYEEAIQNYIKLQK